jgi:hypothetical protein
MACEITSGVPKMYHHLPDRAGFWSYLFTIDQDLAETARKQGCLCGGRLHCANYPRQPRGTSVKLPKHERTRLSFTCDRDGCRKRVTPPSVRFLGPKVYFGAVLILISAMRQGPSPRRVRELTRLFGADRRTIARWQVFWREHFPQTPFWKIARARLAPVIDVATLPLALLTAFLNRRGDDEDWAGLLRFLAPITVAGGLRIAVS